MQVIVEGIQYLPACAFSPCIGIAITTHNRSDVFSRALGHQLLHLPTGALVVVIDDASAPAATAPDAMKLIRHNTSLGIVASKNASLTALMDAGCEYPFLYDDALLSLSIACTKMQEACMWACRSVAPPDAVKHYSRHSLSACDNGWRLLDFHKVSEK